MEQVTTVGSRRKDVFQLISVALLFGAIGLWYAGPAFIHNFATAIPSGPVGGGVAVMTPGDQFEQFYRHMLPYFNALRGNSLYYSGYQYNLGGSGSFSEGLIFFPFSLIASALAFLTGPIAAYNTLAILSFCFCGVSGYLLGKRVSGGSIPGGLVAAAVCALLPFRVSFLFGEMVYGTDFALLPLSLYFFLAFLEERTWRFAAAFGVAILCLATANFTLLYWYGILFLPFFALGTALVLRSERENKLGLLRISLAAAIPLALAGAYVFYVEGLLANSGLAQGQSLSEIRFYSPSLENITARWGGNEKSIYLGFSGILALLGAALSFSKRVALTAPGKLLAICALVLLPVSYALSMGLTFDDSTGIPFYTFVFNHLPAANGSRTPGRIIPIAALCVATLAAISAGGIGGMLRRKGAQLVLGVGLVALVAFDFHFSDATMSTLVRENKAYDAISGRQGVAIAIPFQREADHYLNATFQYFAITHDVRMVNGHSSMFPAEWDGLYPSIEGLNSGVATRGVVEELKSRGVRYIMAHNTEYEPKVGQLAISALDQNKALHRVANDGGIVAYEIGDAKLAPETVGIEYFAGIASRLSEDRKDGEPAPLVTEVAGWYSREAYPGQKPFRWMAGTSSVLLVHPKPDERASDVVFQYKCPYGSLSVAGIDVRYTEAPATDNPGWTTITLDVSNSADSAVELSAPALYVVPGDSRKFGCMVGDFTSP